MISDNQLTRFQAVVESEIGLSFLPQKSRELAQSFQELFKNSSFQDPWDYLNWLEKSDQKEKKKHQLVRQLTIGETYLLRDKNLFQVLQDQILGKRVLKIFAAQKSLTIWSAGCSTGEEAYSLAIILDSLRYIYNDWQVNILATDVNKEFLDKAKRGVYSLWSFRQTPQEIIAKYFTTQGDNLYTISPGLKEKVSFFELNLADFSAYPQAGNKTDRVQIILCRNVLMYLSAEIRRRVVSRLSTCLVPGGWLLVSPGEVHLINQPDLKAEQYPGVTLFRKQEKTFKQRKNYRQIQGAKHPDLSGEKAVSQGQILSERRKRQLVRDKKSLDDSDSQTRYQEAFNKACKFYEQGQYNHGIYELTNVLKGLDVRKKRFLLYSESLALMAKLKANSGQKEEALEYIARAIEKEKLNPELYYLQAAIKQEIGRIKEAIQSLQQVLYLDPDCVMAGFNLGLLLLGEGKNSSAHKYFHYLLNLLKSMHDSETVPLSEGITVKQLRGMIYSLF